MYAGPDEWLAQTDSALGLLRYALPPVSFEGGAPHLGPATGTLGSRHRALGLCGGRTGNVPMGGMPYRQLFQRT